MNQLWITLKYCFGLLLHPINTTSQIIRERNQQASYYAVWITLLTMIVNFTMLLQTLTPSFAKAGIPDSSANIVQFAAIFILVPISFFLGRFLFLAFTKGGLRILSRKTYPREDHERIYLSNTLRMMYPYFYIPTTFQMVFLLLNYPGSEMYRLFLSMIASIYTLVIQIVTVKRIYKCSGIVAFFAPMIVVLVVGGVFLLIWLFTTGAVGIFSKLT